MEFKVMTFNMRYDSQRDIENSWHHRNESVADLINIERPLIVGAQEITDIMKADLEKHLPDYEIFGMKRTLDGEATPILYLKDTIELIEGGTFWLSTTPNIPDTKSFNSFCHRICTWGLFCFKEDRKRTFRIFNTHLDHKSEEAKYNGIKIVYDKVKELNDLFYQPSILMGDFNSKPDSKIIKLIKEILITDNRNPTIDAFDLLEDENKVTTFHDFTGKTKGEPIDYIFYTKDILVNKTKIYTDKINGRYVSDHYPVSINFKFNHK